MKHTPAAKETHNLSKDRGRVDGELWRRITHSKSVQQQKKNNNFSADHSETDLKKEQYKSKAGIW